MLYGGLLEFKGNVATAIFAGISTSKMTDEIAEISSHKNNYEDITQPTGKDKIKMKIFSGIKNPITIFIHSDEQQRSDFISANNIEILDRTSWEYYQEKMFREDEIESMQDQKDIADLDAISGVMNHTSIAKELGLDEVDPWDTRTEKQKAEDLLAHSHHVRQMVESGMLTDEAVAGADSQSGSKEAAILDMVEHIKNGGTMIDPDNIPPQFQQQIDKMIEDGDLRESDIPRFIDDMNNKVKEYCENGKLDEIMRIFGGVDIDATGTDGKIFINTKRNTPKKIEGPTTAAVSDIEQKLFAKKTDDQISEILKPASIDGTLKTDAEKYIFENTSLDKYDLQDHIESIKSEMTSSPIEFDVSSLPENIGINSDINYESSTKEFAYHAKLIDEDAGVYAFFPKGIGIEISSNNIIGTTNVDIYAVTSGTVLFTLKDKDYKTAYFVIQDRHKIILNINV